LRRAVFRTTWILGMFGPPGTDASVVLSPDGKRAVVKDSPFQVPGDLWTLDFAGGSARVSHSIRTCTRLACGLRIASAWVLGRPSRRHVIRESRVWPRQRAGAVQGAGCAAFVTSWSRDGRLLLYHTENAPTLDTTCGHCPSATASRICCSARLSMSG